MPISCRGRTRRNAAAASVARKHAVPDAVSQLNVNTAAYGDADGVTGGIRVIALCSPGTNRPFMTVGLYGMSDGSMAWVRASIAFLIAGAPTASTNRTSSRYGDQATKISRPVYRPGVRAIG